jgi:hypothetical protein
MRKVFVYWHDWSALSPCTAYCLASIERAVSNTADCELVRMDNATGLDELLYAGLHSGATILHNRWYPLFSDLLRFALLDRYGGMWVDLSTLIWSDDLGWVWDGESARACHNPRLYPLDPLLGIESYWLVAPAGHPFVRAVLDEFRREQHRYTTRLGRLIYACADPTVVSWELQAEYHTVYFAMHRVLARDRSLLRSIRTEDTMGPRGMLHYMNPYILPVLDWTLPSLQWRLQGVQRSIDDVETRPPARMTKLTRDGRACLSFPRTVTRPRSPRRYNCRSTVARTERLPA